MPHAHDNYFSFTGSLPGFPRGNQDSPGGPGCGFTKSLSPPCLTRPPPVPLFPPSTPYGILSLLNRKGDKWLWGPDWGGGISVAF